MTPARSSAGRATVLLAFGALTAGLLVGCGSDGDGTDADRDEPTVETTSTESAGTDPTAGYLAVPEGVVLTEPGTALDLGEEATIAWEPRQDTVVALDVTVERIDRTTYEESFEGWVVTKQMKAQVPYFVRVTTTNVGEKTVGRLLVPLYGMATSSSMYEPLNFREEVFEPCPGGNLPTKLKAGRSADLCFVYLLPKDQELVSAAFDPADEQAPVTWSGPITEIEPPKKDDDDKDDKGKKGEDAEQDEQGEQDEQDEGAEQDG